MNATTEHATGSSTSTTSNGAGQAGSLPFCRPSGGRMIAGVAAGVARGLGIDPLIVRIAFVVLALAGGAGVPMYLAGWLLIPDEQTGQSLAAELIRAVSAGR